ncbi:MAG: tetratricopeptide repeat protein, partial [Phycisphaerae bacterium]|nr:tetratricopeptide repeat protein [Phycisphaerae bacterium]
IGAYDQGNAAEAVRQLDTFLRDYGRMQRADEARYYRGLAHYGLGQVNAAQEDLQRAAARTSDDQLRGKALIGLADIAYDADDMPEAERLFVQSLDNLERGRPPRGRVLYRLGDALQRQSRWPQANRYFNQLIGDFAGTALARQAGQRVNGRHWTVEAGRFDNTSDAQGLATTLGRAGLSTVLWRRMVDDRLIVYVYVGQYSTYEHARRALPQVRDICPDAVTAVSP